jgi:hypothetical protein
MPGPGQPRWRLPAEDINHLTVAWYAFDQAKNWLA